MKRMVEPSRPPAQQIQPEQAPPTPLVSLMDELRMSKRSRGNVSMLGANFESAVSALWMNRMRSFLTTLGIFIGIASVVAALMLTQGLTASVNSQIGALGNTITVSPGSANSGGVSQGSGTLSTLTLPDAQSLTGLAHVIGVCPMITVSADHQFAGNPELEACQRDLVQH